MKAFETMGKVNENGQLSEQPESDSDDTPIEEIKASLQRALQEVKERKTQPISDLWNNIDLQ